MTENQNIPIDQHYVPRSYLRNFSKIIGEGRKEKNHVCFFQFSGEFYKENVPTKSICYKHYFYGEDGILEKSLSIQESQWSKVLKKVVKCNGMISIKMMNQLLKNLQSINSPEHWLF